MENIEVGKSFRIENLLSLRKKVTRLQANQEILKIQQFLKNKGVKKNGPLINTTFSIEMVDGEQVLDMEFLIPIDKVSELPEEYTLKKELYLANAVFARHVGNPSTLQNVYNKINNYIKQNNLRPIATSYNVNVKEANSAEEINEMVIDIYLPVNPCVL
ncbi:GyrI-like domain-containing protein [Clostridium sp. ZS2-4]|uniref:GyrI-like domain-containing protein n=1 Tax=Clostridium sp. ZS2-4 TaxID=2987703 RepID=UPI00227BE495|nr:GyrI-like domain-containing protein [Clostridium sp. ZS2-4]MCY6355557.1 GyrI-like domain-containing protein [Clostridium sp. ZS2-4]